MDRLMRVLCAPDSFKGSITAADAAGAIAAGVRQAAPDAQVDCCPIADGGEGTLDAFAAALGDGFGLRQVSVTGPTGAEVDAAWGVIRRTNGSAATGVVEMAAASGLILVPESQRDPTRTTSFGTGELIRAALDAACGEIILGIGGSATCDGGAGAAQALGIRFFSADGELVPGPIRGGDLERIARIDPPRPQRDARIRIACDVTNPLLGPRGAAAVYGPQKGATPRQVEQLERGLAHLASLLPEVDASRPGMGAAGGMALMLTAASGAIMERGIDLILDLVRFDQRAQQADLIITGEGRFDGQTASGKAVDGVIRRARVARKPVLVVAGSVGADAPTIDGLHLRSLVEAVGCERAMQDPAGSLAHVVHAWVRESRGV